MHSANKVALNTGILYVRMLLTVGISLYATRLVLNALGEADFGIFNLIAGVIAMLSFLNAAMSTSTQRFLSFHQGKKNISMQRKVFTNSLVLHIIIGGLIVIGLEIAGLFLFNGFLNIPADRISSAKIIYHFMSVTVFFTVIAVPFTGSLTAHENMLWIAVVNIVETLLKLAIAWFLLVIHSDKLVMYGLLTACITAFSFILYAIYCFKKYDECTLNNITIIDKSLIKELTSFAGWNLFGSLCMLGRTQGLAVMLNLFFGAVVNAAYGIANQVTAQLNFFSTTMLRALNPQIMKSEGANDRDRMLRLSMFASKFGFFLLAFVAVPCIFEMPAILQFWLKKVPDYTVVFCCLILVGALVNQLTIGLQSAAQATGKIKVYQAVVGSVLLLNLPVAYFLLKLNFPVYSVLVTYIVIEAIACSCRLFFLRMLAGLSIGMYFSRVLNRILIPLLAVTAVCFLITHSIHFKFRFIITVVVSTIVFIVSIFFTGLCDDEKKKIIELVRKLKSKLLKQDRAKLAEV